MGAAALVSAVLFIPISFQMTVQSVGCAAWTNLFGSTVPRTAKAYLRQRSTSSTASISVASTYSDEEEEEQQRQLQPFNVSVWLMPPADVNGKLQSEIDRLASLHQPDASSISFAPHVTIVGGIAVDSEAQVNEMAQSLRDGLKGFGSIDCKFDKQLAFETNSDGQAVWNQAAVATLQTTPAFLQLCQKARILLGMHASDCMFPPPILHPHMSLYYGRKGVPSESDMIEPVPDFTADRIALWKTSPSENEQGVPMWRELAVISL